MPVPYSSRELSERVELDFQRRPNRFRRRIWWSSLLFSLLCIGWLTYAGGRGQYRIFEGGDLASPHRLFENDCARCHTTWAPVDRLVSLDISGKKVTSVENKACLACHPGSTHHEKQIPAHDSISCAYCHIEHIGDHDLKRVSDRVCVECHRDLQTTDGAGTNFASAIGGFDEKQGHPTFALERLLDAKSPSVPGIGPDHRVLTLMAFSEGRGWQDKTQIRFNHAAHLKPVSGEAGTAVFQIAGSDRVADPAARAKFGPFEEASRTCQACHEAEADGRYMKPIAYDTHCRECHPLLFDNQRYPKETVPHGISTAAVRGFLTDRYTLAAVRNPESVPAQSPARPIPGRQVRAPLSPDQAGWVEQQVAVAEQTALRHSHALFGAEAKGGCAYCHTVEHMDEPGHWQIVRPEIPYRWQPHARFHHLSHQMLNCAECHGDVLASKDTGDVLMPKIDVCRKCHAAEPAQPFANGSVRHIGARMDCVECHGYHDHSKDSFAGDLNPVLEASLPGASAVPPREGSK